MANTSYDVKLQRTVNDTKLGPSVMTVSVQAPSSIAAKSMAESMARGYKALRADTRR